MRVHLLTPGFTTPNGRAFLFPLVVWRRELLSVGIEFRFFSRVDAALTDCDVLAIDSKFYAPRWHVDGYRVESEIATLAEHVPKTLWFDITDSSGWDHARPLPYVTGWIKNQLLCDRSLYLRPIYGGGRLFADFAHANAGVDDEYPLWSEPIDRPELLRKLHVGWNSGLADYSMLGPMRMAGYGRLPWESLLNFPNPIRSPESSRPLGLSCRFGTSYVRASVAWQRQKIASQMDRYLSTGKLGRRAYLRELEQARVVISPFGLGEITLKDFEVFLTGGALLKPDMSHVETWPNFFQAGETMAVHAWDLSNFQEVWSNLLANDEQRMAIARRGQELYACHTVGQDAPELFTQHLQSILAIGE